MRRKHVTRLSILTMFVSLLGMQEALRKERKRMKTILFHDFKKALLCTLESHFFAILDLYDKKNNRYYYSKLKVGKPSPDTYID